MFKKVLKKVILIIIIVALLLVARLFFGEAPKAEKITWGVNFSQKQAMLLDLDWREAYLAILYDLKVPTIRIAAYWDLIEKEPGEYSFEDLDFQIEEAQDKGVEVMLVFGKKVPRWPECHIPNWARGLSREEQDERVLRLIEKIVIRYHSFDTIWAWQTENEPFFRFGECRKITEEFLKKEIDLVKSLDPQKRPVVISDSGSGRFWIKTSRLGDMVSMSLYRKVWFKEFNTYVTYPLPPVFYWNKARIVDKLFGKEVFCSELQAEPWGPVLISELSFHEQEKTMNLEKFRENVKFARETGFDQFYLWGAEWWYWLKEKHGQPKIWEEAGKLIRSGS